MLKPRYTASNNQFTTTTTASNINLTLAFQFQRPENGHVAAVTTDQQRSSSPAQFLFMVA